MIQLGARPVIRSHGTTHGLGSWTVTTGPGLVSDVGSGPGLICFQLKLAAKGE